MSDSKVFRKYDSQVYDIVDHFPKTVDAPVTYRVRWKGLPPYTDTWESLDDLACADKIAAHKIAAYYENLFIEKHNEKIILRSNDRTRKQYKNSLEATKKRKHTEARKNSS